MRYEEESPSLAKLSVGETVFRCSVRHVNWRRMSVYERVTVTRVLKKYFEISNGEQYNDGGRKRGAMYGDSYVVLNTPVSRENAVEADRLLLAETRRQSVSAINWETVTEEAIAQIAEILSKPEARKRNGK